MILNTVLYIIFSICLALAISYYFYFYKTNNTKNKIYKYLFLLRAFTIFLLLLFILNPKFNKKKYTTIKPNLLVAIDQSSSIKFLKQSELVKQFVNDLKSDKKLNKKFNLHYFGFGNNIQKLDSLNFNKNHTNIFKALNQLNNLYDNNSAILLVTDGNQTNGNDYQFYKSKLPIYTLTVGDTSNYEDLKIIQVNNNDFTFKGNRFPVEAFLKYQGNKSIKSQFSVLEHGKVIYTKTIKFSNDNNVKSLNFKLSSKQAGVHQYLAVINPLKGEKKLKNNKYYFSIKTLGNQSKILLISNIKHPDIGALKRSIESNNQRKLTVLIGNGSQINLKNYQLIIIYQPNNNQSILFKNIQENNIPFIIITGTQTNWNFLNRAQQIFYKTENGENQEYSPYINKSYEPFMIGTLNFDNFPPLLSKFGKIKFHINPQALVYSKINNFKSNQVLVSTFNINNRREAVIFGENIWKWRMAWFRKNKSFTGFDNFINNLIQYLSSNHLKNKIKVFYKPVVFANESIEFRAELLDDIGNFDNRGKLKIKINKENSTSKNIFPLILNNNQYKLTINNLKPGNYKFNIYESKRSLNYNGKFVILNFPTEKQFYNANFNKLHILASYNKGKTFLLKNYQKILAKLETVDKFKSIEKETIKTSNFISFKWLFLLAVISASVEWFIRKYQGLI